MEVTAQLELRELRMDDLSGILLSAPDRPEYLPEVRARGHRKEPPFGYELRSVFERYADCLQSLLRQ